MEINETAIIQSCQQGRLEEFGLLYDSYIRKIYDFIYYKVQHKETAEDLTSVAFTKALEKIRTFSLKKGTFQSWLYQIARNTVIDFYRTKKQENNIEDYWDLADDTDIMRDADTRQKLSRLDEYLKTLKSEQRELFILKAWQGYSYKEIAELSGKSEASLKMSFSRTLFQLKKNMPLSLFISLLLFS